MCDPIPFRNWLFAILATITSAAATVIGAAIVNGSFKYVYLSPIGMLVAAGFTGLSVLFCGQALDALNILCTCTAKRCTGQCNNIRNIIIATRVVLGIQTTACLTVALYAWIPLAAQPAIWAIAGALLIQIPLIISAIVFFNNLASCSQGR